MIKDYLHLFQLNGKSLILSEDYLKSGDKEIPILNGIPRFTPNETFVSGNFSMLREKHRLLQFDSHNGTNHRLETLLTRTNWPRNFFKGKTVLECGCGAGPDTEILLKLGATVIAVDLTGLDIAKENLKNNNEVLHVQASIMDLPFCKKAFDVVFCHRVLQHTPTPSDTLDHILQFVKEGGAVFVHSYANSFVQRFRWKYFLRPLTVRMNSEKLYNLILKYSRLLYKITKPLEKFYLGKMFNWMFMPFYNYCELPIFKDKPEEFIINYGIHDTFDALSPKYDKPIRAILMEKIARKHLKRPFEIVKKPTITLLRTKV
jgi:2-polyprenyl-3-methyl-5-hydroxy-6-metoxy-1,4-benzoquinol methylase